MQTRKKKTEDRTLTTPDLSWVGIITGLQDGDIEVHWANGMISKVCNYSSALTELCVSIIPVFVELII